PVEAVVEAHAAVVVTAIGPVEGAALLVVQAVVADGLLQGQHARVPGHRHQGSIHLGAGTLDAGDGPDRRIGDLRPGEGGRHRRAPPQLVRYTQLLEGGAAGHLGAPHEPVRPRELAVEGPALVAIELGQHVEPGRLVAVYEAPALRQPGAHVEHGRVGPRLPDRGRALPTRGGPCTWAGTGGSGPRPPWPGCRRGPPCI